MATRKRKSTRSGLVGRAMSAGRQALREAEKRVPPDLRRQVERGLKDADKTARAAIKQLQAQAKKASTRADVNGVLKRIDTLTKQARQVVRGGGSRASTARRRGSSTTRRAASTTGRAGRGARRKAAPRASAQTTRSTAAATPAARTGSTPRRRPTPRRRGSGTEGTSMMPETMGPEAGGRIAMGEISSET